MREDHGVKVDSFKQLILEFFKTTVADHQASIGPKARRDLLQATCDHRDWDIIRHWCRRCGMTKLEHVTKHEAWN